jgi:hypothetical protein
LKPTAVFLKLLFVEIRVLPRIATDISSFTGQPGEDQPVHQNRGSVKTPSNVLSAPKANPGVIRQITPHNQRHRCIDAVLPYPSTNTVTSRCWA